MYKFDSPYIIHYLNYGSNPILLTIILLKFSYWEINKVFYFIFLFTYFQLIIILIKRAIDLSIVFREKNY